VSARFTRKVASITLRVMYPRSALIREFEILSATFDVITKRYNRAKTLDEKEQLAIVAKEVVVEARNLLHDFKAWPLPLPHDRWQTRQSAAQAE
jgi:hypothetical protein